MLNYDLLGLAYKPTETEIAIIDNAGHDWSDVTTSSYKTNLKKHVLVKQLDRCAYCRKIVEADGYYEPLEHIVPQSKRNEWIFVPTNLIVTCDRCNNLKGAEQTLNDDFKGSIEYPSTSEAFTIFTPYFDKWEDHLTYENDIFITAKPDSKGDETIRICQLYKYNVIVNRAKELKLGQKDPLGRSINRLCELDKASKTYQLIFSELINVMTHFKERVNDAFV